MPTVKSFFYNELEKGCIRLLKLNTGDESAPLTGCLFTYFLRDLNDDVEFTERGRGLEDDVQFTFTGVSDQMYEEVPEYVALSYSWGKDEALAVITIYDYPQTSSKLGTITIRPNLEEALKTFRRKITEDQENREKELFWIDAICINQDENNPKAKDEKSGQLVRMTEIYNNASEVRIWLGKGDPQNDMAMAFVENLNNFNELDTLSADESRDKDWDAFQQLMRSDWFNRRWIIQEIALARNANVYCGRNSVPWSKFTYAVSVFVEKAPALKRLFTRSKRYSHNPDYLGELSVLPAKVLCETIAQLLLKTEDGEVLEYLLPLEALMAKLTYFESSVPHDTVYAILSLAHDAVARSNASARAHDLVQKSPRNSPVKTRFDNDVFEEPNPTSILGDGEAPVFRKSPTPIGDDQTAFLAQTNGQLLHRHSGAAGALLGIPNPLATRSGKGRSDTRRPQTRKHMLKAEGTGARNVPSPIKVNYNLSVYDVCREFLEFVIGSSRLIDIICLPWAPAKLESDDDMPSWITPVTKRPFSLVSTGRIYNRASADPLVVPPGSGPRIYNASGKTRAFDPEKLSSKDLINNRVLRTRGRLLDKIREVADPATDSTIPKRWPEMAGWDDFANDPPLSYLRCMVADRDNDGQGFIPPYFARACQWAFSRRGKDFPTNTKIMLDEIECPQLAVPFLRRTQAVTCNRRLVLTQGYSKGYEQYEGRLLALVPEEAKEGDSICILHGCSVPVVLRLKSKHDGFKRGVYASRGKQGIKRQRHGTMDQPPRPKKTKTGSFEGAGNEQRLGSMENGLSPRKDDAGAPATSAADAKDGGNTSGIRDGVSDKYVLIGECYVDGMMEGEGFKYADEAKHFEQEFLLV